MDEEVSDFKFNRTFFDSQLFELIMKDKLDTQQRKNILNYLQSIPGVERIEEGVNSNKVSVYSRIEIIPISYNTKNVKFVNMKKNLNYYIYTYEINI